MINIGYPQSLATQVMAMKTAPLVVVPRARIATFDATSANRIHLCGDNLSFPAGGPRLKTAWGNPAALDI